MSLMDTPSAQRVHIAIFGKRNSGKSTLFNTLTHQNYSLVSNVAGTTTDPVRKACEYHGIGPVVFIDTAGFDDEGSLGTLRVEKSKQIVDECDIVLLVLHDDDLTFEHLWMKYFKDKQKPIVCIYNTMGNHEASQKLCKFVETYDVSLYSIDVKNDQEVDTLRPILTALYASKEEEATIVSDYVKSEDVVMLVMPQDIQAPKGRLILPQVQTIRDLLDHHCIVISCSADEITQTLEILKQPPKLIICDSQVFDTVYKLKPDASRLTSFSILQARLKGDIEYFAQSAKMLDHLTKNSKILIAEACTHAPLSEDIGRVKIPRMLHQKIGNELKIDMVSGKDFPTDLSSYDLIIHCGACMFNKTYVLARVKQARDQHVPMTNYGIFIAYIKKILQHVEY